MANASTLYRFRISLSDVDRGVYAPLDLRVAMHPSETEGYLLTRVLAYALSFEEGLEFSQGISETDAPAIQLKGSSGEILKWIEIGNPNARRLHKASKAARVVRVYTYKDPENIKREMAGEQVHRAEEIEIFSFDNEFLKSLATLLKRDNTWEFVHNEGGLMVTVGKESVTGQLHAHRLERGPR